MANFGTLENNSFLYDDFTGSLQVIAEPSGDAVLNAADILANTTGSISLPPDHFAILSDNNLVLVFTMFNTSVLYPLANETRETFAVASIVIGATVAGHIVTGLTTNVTIVLKLTEAVSIIHSVHIYICRVCLARS